MLQMTELVGFDAHVPGRVDYEFLGVSTSFSGSGTATITFSSVSLGTPSQDRYIVVGGILEAASALTACSINGVSATNVALVNETGPSPALRGAFYYAKVPTGASGDIVFTLNVALAIEDMAIVVYRVDYVSNPNVDSNTANANSSSGFTRTLDAPADGVVIAVKGSTNPGITTTWTGLTEDTDTNAGNLSITSASAAIATADAAYSVTVAMSSSTVVFIVFSMAPFTQ